MSIEEKLSEDWENCKTKFFRIPTVRNYGISMFIVSIYLNFLTLMYIITPKQLPSKDRYLTAVIRSFLIPFIVYILYIVSTKIIIKLLSAMVVVVNKYKK